MFRNSWLIQSLFLKSKLIVKFLLQLGFGGDFKVCFDFGFVLIWIFQISQLFWLIVAWFQSVSPGMKIVEFSDDMDFVDRSDWRRPCKKPPKKFCALNLRFNSTRSTPKQSTKESHISNWCSNSVSF